MAKHPSTKLFNNIFHAAVNWIFSIDWFVQIFSLEGSATLDWNSIYQEWKSYCQSPNNSRKILLLPVACAYFSSSKYVANEAIIKETKLECFRTQMGFISKLFAFFGTARASIRFADKLEHNFSYVVPSNNCLTCSIGQDAREYLEILAAKKESAATHTFANFHRWNWWSMFSFLSSRRCRIVTSTAWNWNWMWHATAESIATTLRKVWVLIREIAEQGVHLVKERRILKYDCFATTTTVVAIVVDVVTPFDCIKN